MKKTFLALVVLVLFTSAYYQREGLGSGGSWTFKSNHCTINKFAPHNETLAVFDTTQNPHPKLIIDFHDKFPAASGKYTVVKGSPLKDDQIGIGVGFLHAGGLTFYSSTGCNGKQIVTVTVSNGKVNISGTGIEMKNQNAPHDLTPLTFNVTRAQ